MSDENNDVNTTQVVTETQDANTEQVVIAQDVNTDVVDQQSTEQAGENQDQSVPYERFKEVNDAKKVAEEQAAYAQRQLDLINMNAQQQQVQTAPKTVSEQALANLGITEDDLYEPKNIIKYQEAVTQINNAQAQQSNAVMQTQEFMMTHPDIANVVGSVNPVTGQIMQASPELLALVAQKPYLRQASTQDLYLAVQDERKFSEYQKTAVIQKEHQTRTGVKTETQPLGGSAAGGGGSGSQGSQQMLTREQSQDIERRLAAGEIIS